MALTSLAGSFLIPNPLQWPSNNASAAMNASGTGFMCVFTVPKTGNLSKVRFRTGTVTTSDTLRVSFQDRDGTTGNPDATADQYRTISGLASNTWYQTGILSSDGTDGGSKRAVTRGDRVCVVFEFSSYVAGNLNIQYANVTPVCDNDTYVATLAAGTWTKVTGAVGQIEIEYDDATLAKTVTLCPSVNSNATLASNTTPDEIALYFQVPVQLKVDGAYVALDLDGDCDIVLYDSNGTTALATVSYDKDNRQGTAVSNTWVDFGSEITLAANTSYRLAIRPSTTTAVGYRYLAVNAQASWDAFDLGQNTHWSQRTDAGAWTQTTTQRIKASLRVSQVHDGSGSGGFIIGG